MKLKFEVDALLFDLDGTLLNTIPDLYEAARRMLEEVGQPTRSIEEVTRFVGKGIQNMVTRCLTEGRPDVDPDLAKRALPVFNRHYAAVNGVSTRMYEGVDQTLVEFARQGIRMACVTNKAADFTAPLLEKMGLASFFACVVSGDTLAFKKPSPEPLLHACEVLGVAPARTVMIGDSANDAAAAQAAGIPVLLLTYGYSEGRGVDSIECDGLVSSFPALKSLVGRS